MRTMYSFERMSVFALLATALTLISAGQLQRTASAQEMELYTTPNYQQARQYSSTYIRQFLYSTSVRPTWIGKTDKFWYSFEDSKGKHYYLVDPKRGTKGDLFDATKLAPQLSVMVKKPLEATDLALSRLKVDDNVEKLTFNFDKSKFEFDLNTEELTKVGKAEQGSDQNLLPRSRFQSNEQYQRYLEFVRNRGNTNRRQGRGTASGGRGESNSRNRDHRNWSPDRHSYVFAKGHDLYFVELPEEVVKKGIEETKKREARAKARAKARAERRAKEAKEKENAKKDDKKGDDKKDGDEKKEKDGDEKESDDKDSDDQDVDKKEDGQKDSDEDGEKKEEDSDDKDSDDKDSDDEDSDDKDSDDKDSDDEDSDDEDSDDEDSDDEDSDDEDSDDEDSDDEDSDDEDSDDEDSDDEDSDDEDSDKDSEKKDSDKKDSGDKDESKEGDSDTKSEDKADDKEKELPIPKIDDEWDDKAIRLSKNGENKYSFAGGSSRGRFGRSSRGGVTSTEDIKRTEIKPDQKTRPNVSWSEDSQSFHVSRRDSRGIKELWVINSLANPRPTLEAYSYPMPGEKNVYKSELYTFCRTSKELTRVTPKWKDEGYSSVAWTKDGKKLKFLRTDRLLRNVEFCLWDPKGCQCKCLIEEGFENSHLARPNFRYLDDTDEMIWWSERSGWGHYYLYDRNGDFKNAITTGPFRASSIVAVDEKNRLLYFRGNGEVPEENIYHEHLYSVRFDGSGLKMLDPGAGNHSSSLSPSRSFLIDNCSAVDMTPKSTLRDSNGEVVMELEEADLSRLYEVGWEMPSTFKVKAADGVTDLYGNMWKPFNFNPKKKYPVILHVYPGPQTEGTRHTFSATVGEQQLAQVGFIVIQVGHRGGAPTRSKAYGAYGYYNLRDYGLADKKAAVEQLAARFQYVDVNRVGLYGHSGGGFMTAAALLKPPYNEFFKVGFSTAGNHDNNIYNNSWSERYHGLKLVKAEEAKDGDGKSTEGRSNSRSTARPGEYEYKTEFDVEATDFFYEFEYFTEDYEGEDAFWDTDFPIPLRHRLVFQDEDEKETTEKQEEKSDDKKSDDKKSDEKKSDEKKSDDEKSDKKDSEKSDDKKDEEGDSKDKDSDDEDSDDEDSDDEDSDDEKEDDENGDAQTDMRFEIRVPTNAELAENLKGHLFLVHGELDNNVHPANTLRLVDALIKANKRFDMLYLPEKRHGFGSYQPYVTQRMYEYFAEHLLDDYQDGADIGEKK